jgi:hypothetical protein
VAINGGFDVQNGGILFPSSSLTYIINIQMNGSVSTLSAGSVTWALATGTQTTYGNLTSTVTNGTSSTQTLPLQFQFAAAANASFLSISSDSGFSAYSGLVWITQLI